MKLPVAIRDLIDALKAETSLSYELDAPAQPSGEWWLDLEIGGLPVTLSWREAIGFGLYTRDERDAGLGDRPDEIYRKAGDAGLRLLRLAAESKGRRAPAQLGLRDVRHLVGKTQAALAKSLKTDQAGVSRLEARRDWKISTLKDYVAAMGGVLEVRVLFPSFEASIGPGDTGDMADGDEATQAR